MGQITCRSKPAEFTSREFFCVDRGALESSCSPIVTLYFATVLSSLEGPKSRDFIYHCTEQDLSMLIVDSILERPGSTTDHNTNYKYIGIFVGFPSSSMQM